MQEKWLRTSLERHNDPSSEQDSLDVIDREGLTSGFGCCGVDDAADLSNRVRWESPLSGMFPDEILVRRNVDAVDLVSGDIAVDPLNLGTEPAEDAAGGFGDGFELVVREFSSAGDFALDDVLGHGSSVGWEAEQAAPRRSAPVAIV